MSNMINPVFIATLIASIASILVTIFFVRFLLRKTSSSKVVTVSVQLIVLVSYPFAWFLGYIVGGNLGGALASWIPIQFLSNVIKISIGIGIGIIVCTVIISTIAAIFGLGFGQVINKIYKK